jgi:hypothetical protein
MTVADYPPVRRANPVRRLRHNTRSDERTDTSQTSTWQPDVVVALSCGQQ